MTASTSFSGQRLSWELHEGVCELALHHAPCNEIGEQSLSELETLTSRIEHDARGIRALIVHSTIESGFCAGADLRSLYQSIVNRKQEKIDKTEQVVELRAFLDRIHGAFDAIDMAPFTTVAAVHGPVFGGGFELALTCDVIIADQSARFCFPELRLGLIPGFGGIPRLQRDTGNALVRDLLLTGRSIGAKRAHELGLVSQLVSKGRALEVARAVAAQALRFDSETSARGKAFIKRLPAAELQREKDLFCELFRSETVEKALETFVKSKDIRPYLP